ncbi:four helix bundle protein [Segetibacter sp. 3557_3]|uniref:four helix bundle protein n=1 Tax=Segetibacter sp. 3557_3 TaxID=2547429 RepID=UPI001058FC48|nr:four helix bundle protein [Segetibacter sp. 3557_3]TDH25515.1 four helix bundle protein [Segetibacter sp. 3557_3]
MQNEKIETVQEGEKPYNIRHRCFHFSKEIIHFIRSCRYEPLYHSMFDQLLRSSTSIGANMVEGGAESSHKDFVNFMHISLKSANETKYWLCLIKDTLDVNEKKVMELISEANEISKIIASILIRAKN